MNQYKALTEVLEQKDVYTISAYLNCLDVILFEKLYRDPRYRYFGQSEIPNFFTNLKLPLE